MEYRKVGQSGLHASTLSIGGWKNFGERLNDSESKRIIHSAVEYGINSFDTADVYGNAEAAMGRAFKGLDRNKLVISSKCYWPMSNDINDRGLSRKHIRASVHSSLKKMNTDYIDIYLCHRFDEHTPLRETIRTYDDLIREGKILYWGTSAWTKEQIEEAFNICHEMGWEPPITEQAEYSLLARDYIEQEIAPLRAQHGLGLMCWGPLASGILAGKNLDHTLAPESLLATYSPQLRSKYLNEHNLAKALKLKRLSEEIDIPMATLSLAWLADNQAVDSIVVGVSTNEQLYSNLRALEFKLTYDVKTELNMIFAPQ
jgi:aryl-alcohol dehydrogenase-like predicted oxidoreductase